MVSELKDAKSALQRKADVAKELATKAKEAAKKAKESEGELRKKLHDAAEKVAEKAKEQAAGALWNLAHNDDNNRAAMARLGYTP